MLKTTTKSLLFLALFFPIPITSHGHRDQALLRRANVEKNEGLLRRLLSPWQSNFLQSNVNGERNNHELFDQWKHRSLQRNDTSTRLPPKCGDVLASWNREETIKNVQTMLESVGQLVGVDQDSTLAALLQVLIKHGVRIQKVCGSCKDFPSIGGPCAEGNYGANVLHSGVMVLPLDQNTSDIVAGNHMGVLYMHPSRASGSYDQDWQNSTEIIVDILFNVIVTASVGTVNVLPDYMGYGESLNVTCKSYLIRQGYGVATIPLLEVAKQTVKTETNCKASVVNAVAVVGYSEGGYAALAVADSLNSLGYEIIRLEMGAAPLRLSSLQLGLALQDISTDTVPPDGYYLSALLGLAYSSTCKSLANYGQGQDLMDSQYRELYLELSNRDVPYTVFNENFPADDPTLLVNGDVLNATRPLLQSNILDLCAPNATVNGATDKLCQAFRDQDLDAVFLNVTYPTRYCYSVDDTRVSPKNIPDGASGNPNIEFITTTGDHGQGGAFCLVQYLYFLTGPDFASFEVTDDMVDSCDADSTLGFSSAKFVTPVAALFVCACCALFHFMA